MDLAALALGLGFGLSKIEVDEFSGDADIQVADLLLGLFFRLGLSRADGFRQRARIHPKSVPETRVRTGTIAQYGDFPIGTSRTNG